MTKGTTIFSCDQFSNLVSARESGFETIFRTTDEVGNLFETQDNSDRIYGGGSRLEQSGIDLKEKRNKYQGGHGALVTKGNRFFYDEEGNLVKKIEANGDTWHYVYFGNGMLKEVIRPDQSALRFKYDAFGRRTKKAVTTKNKNQEKVTRFLWDGNTPFHEWEETREVDRKQSKVKVEYQADFMQRLAEREAEKARQRAEQKQPENLITWVFQDDFIPRGKMTRIGNYSIIGDYLGTPVEAYDGEGRKVWERELDIYGRIKKVGKGSERSAVPKTGGQCFIPFRFQGQYEDEENGLYYNRFRYYDPSLGQYTQQDPIGLAGGNPTLYGYVFNTLCEVDPFGFAEEFVFRGMIEDGGKPKVGNTARTLGARPNVDIPIDKNGMVYPETGGISVAPSPEDLPAHRRPSAFDGTGKEPVWKMSTSDLGSDLAYVQDKPNHGTIQPSKPMPFDDYQKALEGTQRNWENVKCH